ncbi:MAG TPA: glycoside hydrolase family 11 protein [Polyangiaceae bacterium]|jgi:endo-1,4-beta-xylanase|nr:glycoside hydrolase family 11 protein [Polyangiaceae bacterium]
MASLRILLTPAIVAVASCSSPSSSNEPFSVSGSTSGIAGTSGSAGTASGVSGSVTGNTGTTAGTTGATGSTAGTSGQSGTAGSSGNAGASGSTSGDTSDGDAGACAPGDAWSGGTTHSGVGGQGTADGSYTWNLYASGGGSDSITVAGVDAKFSAMWNNAGDFLARVGLQFNSTQTPTQIGTLEADFAETKTGTGGGFSYIGVYGWSENPLHEYYIVDDWFGTRPLFGTKVGTITVDGGTYDVLQNTQTNQPAITGGNATFVQFLSIRQTARQCGHISISEHFSQWAQLGLQLGNMEEARILVEAGGGSGSIDFTTATLTNN